MKKRILLLLLGAVLGARADCSKLWGKAGERWSEKSRLPDFSFAGYHSGEAPLPEPPVASNVRNFGAKGDGKHDDTAAFVQAIAATESGAILVPAGRYVISDILWIKKPNIVLRGEGPDRSVLVFPKSLDDVRPNMSATTSGRPTSGYSWSGGFVWARGSWVGGVLSPVVGSARRGDHFLTLEKRGGLKPGQYVYLEQVDTPEKTLIDHLYGGDPGNTAEIVGPVRIRFVGRIESVDGRRVQLERPLRTDVRPEWKPVLRSFRPSVREVGIEGLGFEFPNTPYKGHFTETGRNAIALNNVADCWVRNVRIRNADSGIFLSGSVFCTVSGVVLESQRLEKGGCTGHHGLTFGTDCLFENFDYRTHFIHDITEAYRCAGNVSKNGRGINLSFDHHKMGNHENLFCNIDVGRGTEIWRCGGGRARGKHCGARGTFWCIRSATDIHWPPERFGPDSMNLVGVQTSDPSQTSPNGKWFEAIPPERLQPADLHAAQLERRLNRRSGRND